MRSTATLTTVLILWIAAFALPASQPDRALPLALLVESEALGSSDTGTVMGLVLAVAPEDLERTGDMLRVVTTLVSGDIVVDRRSAVVEIESDGSVMLYRDWPEGAYRLEVSVATLDGLTGGFWAGEVEVPVAETPFEAPPGAAVEAVALGLTQPDLGGVRFFPPPDRGGIGALQLEVEAPEETASVEFFKDGESLLRRNRPPWTVSVNLGEVIRRTRVRAVARDRQGSYLGEDALVLNSPTGQIGVEILVSPDDSVKDGERTVTVAVSGDGQIHEVTLNLDDRQVARWPRCPCVVQIPEADLDQATILAAEAIDSKGRRGDTVVALGGGIQFSGSVRVELVELPITVFDERGVPVRNLKPEDFSILEDGRDVSIEGFGTMHDLALSLALAVDTSGSMTEDFPAVLSAAQGFATDLMGESDEMIALTFAWEPVVRLPWTTNSAALVDRLQRIVPEGGTSLNDAVVRSLEQFRGRRGRQALVLLTDGEDTASRTGSDLSERFAHTMRVPIFPIGLGLGKLDFSGRKALRLFAETTGGEAFFPEETDELEEVYRRIGDLLRSQYLVWYSSDSNTSPDTFRTISVTLPDHPDLTIRTVTGYYPGR